MKLPVEDADPKNLMSIAGALSKGPDSETKHAFARSGWNTSDSTTVSPIEMEKKWYEMSEEAKKRELQKISGTYRPPGGERELARKRSRGILKDRDQPVQLAKAVLIKAGMPKRPPPPSDVPRWCLHCAALIGPEKRSNSKFCSSAHKTAYFRALAEREAQRQLSTILFAPNRVPQFSSPEPEPALGPVSMSKPGPLMTGSYAIASNRVGEFLAARRNRVTDSGATFH